jgi:hypothetical protein
MRCDDEGPEKEGTMSDDKDAMRQARKLIGEMSKMIEDHQTRLSAAGDRLQLAMARLRAVCTHARIVAVEMPKLIHDALPGSPGQLRFCLDCGEADTGLVMGGLTGSMSDGRFLLLPGEPKTILPESFIEKLVDRLNFRGRFDEFDEDGKWMETDEDERDKN